jgi:two-component system chemotaxis response regulator CheB
MSDLRILIVDDSVAVRRALTDAIDGEPGLSVCGAAPNGVLALELIERTPPDLVVLDLEMPVMDGLEFLTHLRPTHPRLPVLVFSGTAGHANEATLEAMWRGASDYVLKPRGLLPSQLGPFLRTELFPRVRALAGERRTASDPRGAGTAGSAQPASHPPATSTHVAATPASSETPLALPVSRTASGRDPSPSVVLIGASTGGPRALAAVLGALTTEFPLPIVVVQHMPAEMTEFFATGLSFNCPLPVRMPEQGELVTPGTVWVAPGGSHLTIGGGTAPGAGSLARARFLLDRGPEENGCRPAVDPLLRTAAQVYGPGVLAVVLTGMGHDGLNGARAVHAAHGRVLVQDEATSVVWGMPGAIARAGLAHAMLPLQEIGSDLLARARRGTRGPHGSPPRAEAA